MQNLNTGVPTASETISTVRLASSPSMRIVLCIDWRYIKLIHIPAILIAHLLIQYWNGVFFERVTLKSIGFRVQLGHGVIDYCVRPVRAFGDEFVVIDDHGIHEIGLDFCGCGTHQPHHIQLLRAKWFPATVVNPKTAATFHVLERFHLLTLESKASAFEFINSLARETNNSGTKVVPVSICLTFEKTQSLTCLMSYQDRYPAFLRMMREWRHLKMLKRSGRGHDPAGVAATKEGECAVVCPACPQPDRNLPPGWEHAPVGVRYVCPQPSVRPSSLLFQDGYMPFFSQLMPISACSATIFPLT
jgi:hypothetical protein